MQAQLSVIELKVLQLLYEQQAVQSLKATEVELLLRRLSISWEDLRICVDKLEREGYVVLKQRHMRARIFYMIYLTSKGIETTSELSNPVSPDIHYHNFDLILREATQKVQVEVWDSPAGDASGESPLPLWVLDNSAYEVFRQYERLIGEDLCDLGEQIGKLLFPDPVLSRLTASLSLLAPKPHHRLRIRLRFASPKLRAIPWETARINGEYLSLRLKTPIVRYVPAPEPISALPTDETLHILGILSSPSDLSPLQVEKERKIIEEALASLIRSHKVTLTWLPDSRIQTLQVALQRQKYHIIHFVGHGYLSEVDQRSGLIFSNDNSESVAVTAERFSVLLRDTDVCFVFLNSCDSAQTAGSIAEEVVRRGVVSALGFQASVSDDLAITFATGFYTAMSNRWPIDAALVEGRKAIVNMLEDDLHQPDWMRPILYTRSPDGQLFR